MHVRVVLVFKLLNGGKWKPTISANVEKYRVIVACGEQMSQHDAFWWLSTDFTLPIKTWLTGCTRNPKMIWEGAMMPQIPTGYNGAMLPHSPQNYPFPWNDPQTQLSASSLDSCNPPSQTASISDQPFCRNAPERHRQTDEQMAGGNVR